MRSISTRWTMACSATDVRVPNAGLREAFLASGVPAKEVAIRCGFLRPNGQADDAAVSRLLGLRAYSNRKKNYRHVRTEIPESDALLILRAIHLDPVDIDL
jgi:hypothetical protein